MSCFLNEPNSGISRTDKERGFQKKGIKGMMTNSNKLIRILRAQPNATQPGSTSLNITQLYTFSYVSGVSFIRALIYRETAVH